MLIGSSFLYAAKCRKLPLVDWNKVNIFEGRISRKIYGTMREHLNERDR
jgi:hypothetical protein